MFLDLLFHVISGTPFSVFLTFGLFFVKIYRSFSCEDDAEIEYVTIDAIRTLYGFERFDFITFALLLGCDFFPSGIKGIGPKMAVKLIKLWKEKNKSPIQRLIAIKNNTVKALGKDEEKLSKLLRAYPEINFQNLILEFKSTEESRDVEKIELVSKSISILQIKTALMTALEWEREKAIQKGIEFYFKSRKNVSDLELGRIVRKVKGGKSYIVEWRIGKTELYESK